MTNTVQDGSKVTLHYKGTYEDGTQFDSSRDRGEPMEVLVGAGQLIQGFNDALVGMSENESKTFTLEPADAYGEVHPEAMTELPRDIFPEGFEFETGTQIPLMSPGGQSVLATITEVKEETIMADLNHPMAGKTLTFEVDVLTVEDTDSQNIILSCKSLSEQGDAFWPVASKQRHPLALESKDQG